MSILLQLLTDGQTDGWTDGRTHASSIEKGFYSSLWLDDIDTYTYA